jgi:hypothetical protein
MSSQSNQTTIQLQRGRVGVCRLQSLLFDFLSSRLARIVLLCARGWQSSDLAGCAIVLDCIGLRLVSHHTLLYPAHHAWLPTERVRPWAASLSSLLASPPFSLLFPLHLIPHAHARAATKAPLPYSIRRRPALALPSCCTTLVSSSLVFYPLVNLNLTRAFDAGLLQLESWAYRSMACSCFGTTAGPNHPKSRGRHSAWTAQPIITHGTPMSVHFPTSACFFSHTTATLPFHNPTRLLLYSYPTALL